MTAKVTCQDRAFATHKKSCRHYPKGFCGYGEKCRFRHNEPNWRLRVSSSDPSEAQNCPFFKKASCKFASKCWYKHIGPNGKVYPRPDPLNKFIVVGPLAKKPDQTVDAPDVVEDSRTSICLYDPVLGLPVVISRVIEKPIDVKTLNEGYNKCSHYKKEGGCHYKEKCWHSHIEGEKTQPTESKTESIPEPEFEPDPDYSKMCYDFIFAECKGCLYKHGDICQFCDLAFLHPSDEQQRNAHLEACEKFFLEDMEIAFKFTVSKDKKCVICLETVWGSEKLISKQKFGIQDNCNHSFCLNCIRRWRKVKRKNNEPLLCPACRKESLVVVPSACWFENEEEKQKLIEGYKVHVAKKPCKFYTRGKCRNEDKCLFHHPGYIPLMNEDDDAAEDEDGTWSNVQSNGFYDEQEDTGCMTSESVTSLRDQQVVGAQNVQGFSSETPPDGQTEGDSDFQSSEEVIPSNLTWENQTDDGFW